MDQLYAEEAEQMAAKQEEVWAREAAARQRLMAEVAASWRKAGQRSYLLNTEVTCYHSDHILYGSTQSSHSTQVTQYGHTIGTQF